MGRQKWSQNLSSNNFPSKNFTNLTDEPFQTVQWDHSNMYLNAIKVLNDDRCGIRKNEEVTLEYVFIKCPLTQIL